MASNSRFHEVCFEGGRENQFITVYPEAWGAYFPEGLGGSWATGFAGLDGSYAPDDIGFIRALLDELQARLTAALAEHYGIVGVEAIDRHRVHAVGFSNGGMFVYRVACELQPTWVLASFCVASGCIGAQVDATAPLVVNDPVSAGAHRASVLILHGFLDPVVPYRGGPPDAQNSNLPDLGAMRGLDAETADLLVPRVLSVVDAEGLWKAALGLRFTLSKRPTNPAMYLRVYRKSLRVAANVFGVVAVAEGSYEHSWPAGGTPAAAAMIWSFFLSPETFV